MWQEKSISEWLAGAEVKGTQPCDAVGLLSLQGSSLAQILASMSPYSSC